MSNEIPYNKVFTCKVIKLQAPNGEYIPFEYLDRIEYEGSFYAVLRQIDAQGTGAVEDGIVILRVDEDPDDPNAETYSGIESEDTLRAVLDLFSDRYKKGLVKINGK